MKSYLDNSEIIYCLNEYLPKKTKTRLLATSKKFNILTIKNYRNKMLLLDLSPLNLIKMFVQYNYFTFYDIFRSFKLFKNVRTRFHHWNNIHWNLVITFLIYRYIIQEYNSHVFFQQPFLIYNGYFNNILIINIDEIFKKNLVIQEVYNIVKRYHHRNIRELILL